MREGKWVNCAIRRPETTKVIPSPWEKPNVGQELQLLSHIRVVLGIVTYGVSESSLHVSFQCRPKGANLPMAFRVKALGSCMLVWAAFDTAWAAQFPSQSWLRFAVLLSAVLLSSGLKVALPRGDGTMSLNFPFILLAVVQLSPLQAILVAALSAAAQCRISVAKLFSAIQTTFNIAKSLCAAAGALF